MNYERLSGVDDDTEKIDKVFMATKQLVEEMQSTVKTVKEVMRDMDIVMDAVSWSKLFIFLSLVRSAHCCILTFHTHLFEIIEIRTFVHNLYTGIW